MSSGYPTRHSLRVVSPHAKAMPGTGGVVCRGYFGVRRSPPLCLVLFRSCFWGFFLRDSTRNKKKEPKRRRPPHSKVIRRHSPLPVVLCVPVRPVCGSGPVSLAFAGVPSCEYIRDHHGLGTICSAATGLASQLPLGERCDEWSAARRPTSSRASDTNPALFKGEHRDPGQSSQSHRNRSPLHRRS